MHATARDTDEQPSRWERVCFAAGIVASTLVLLATTIFLTFIVPSMLPVSAPAAESARFYAAMSDNLLYRSVSYLGEAQMLPLMLFFGGLFGVLRRAERGSGALSTAILIAGVVLVVVTPLAIMLEDHLLLGYAAAGVEPITVKATDGIGPLAFAFGGFAQSLVVCGTAALLLPERLVPRWLGWFGAMVAVLSLIGTGTLVAREFFPVAALAMLLFRVWLLALSIALLHHRHAAYPSVPRRIAT